MHTLTDGPVDECQRCMSEESICRYSTGSNIPTIIISWISTPGGITYLISF